MLNNSYINEPKLGGGKSFEKALTAKIMHNFKGGEVCDYAQLEAALEKRKNQVKELKAKIILEPDNEELKKELAKSMKQGEAVASKMKSIAMQENRTLKGLFCQIDSDASGTM